MKLDNNTKKTMLETLFRNGVLPDDYERAYHKFLEEDLQRALEDLIREVKGTTIGDALAAAKVVLGLLD